jgi:hypothetical protein
VISAYHKDEMLLKVTKANKELAKPAAVYDYNLNMVESSQIRCNCICLSKRNILNGT